MKKLRIIALLLATLTVTAALNGCGKTAEASVSFTEEQDDTAKESSPAEGSGSGSPDESSSVKPSESSEPDEMDVKSHYYSQGLEIVQLMSEMAQSEPYIHAFTGSDAVLIPIQRFANGNYSNPKAVYAITISDDCLAEMAELSVSDLSNMSKNLKAHLLKMIYSAFFRQINAGSGSAVLTATSICTASKTFVEENADGNVTYLYTYDNAAPIAVTFIVGDDKSVSATGIFVESDTFNCNSADEIKASFNNLPDVAVEVVEIDM